MSIEWRRFELLATTTALAESGPTESIPTVVAFEYRLSDTPDADGVYPSYFYRKR